MNTSLSSMSWMVFPSLPHSRSLRLLCRCMGCDTVTERHSTRLLFHPGTYRWGSTALSAFEALSFPSSLRLAPCLPSCDRKISGRDTTHLCASAPLCRYNTPHPSVNIHGAGAHVNKMWSINVVQYSVRCLPLLAWIGKLFSWPVRCTNVRRILIWMPTITLVHYCNETSNSPLALKKIILFFCLYCFQTGLFSCKIKERPSTELGWAELKAIITQETQGGEEREVVI